MLDHQRVNARVNDDLPTASNSSSIFTERPKPRRGRTTIVDVALSVAHGRLLQTAMELAETALVTDGSCSPP